MTKLMMTIHWTGGREKPPTLDEIRQLFSLTDKEIDTAFGVVEVDPQAHIYTILVEENAVPKVQSKGDVKVEGPFSNPRIEPFGPPQ